MTAALATTNFLALLTAIPMAALGGEASLSGVLSVPCLTLLLGSLLGSICATGWPSSGLRYHPPHPDTAQ
jgi:hypothetical protein